MVESLSSAGEVYLNTVSQRRHDSRSASQLYDVSEPTSAADSVGQPLPHRWAAQCCTGEAVFIDDIPPATGMTPQTLYNVP